MHLPPLEPIGDFHTYISGDVAIHPSAAIAPGVLIQADSGSKITIAAGVCIGMGTVLHAQDGWIEIAAGANLGAGVLIFGKAKVGENVCVGASSTIANYAIASRTLVPPGSLLCEIAPPSAELPEELLNEIDEFVSESVQELISEPVAVTIPEAPVAVAPAPTPPAPPTLAEVPWAEPVSTFVDPTLNLNKPDFSQPAELSGASPFPATPFVPPPLLNQPFHQQLNYPVATVPNPPSVAPTDPQIPTGNVPENIAETAIASPNTQRTHGQAQLNQLMGKLFARKPPNLIEPTQPNT
jgi:carbonic anhydrase/acetyltransferase-like protein (isoleucine patch superfamily)